MAIGLAEAGADIAIVARGLEKAEETAHRIARLGVKTIAVQADITVPEQVDAMMKSILKAFGTLYADPVMSNNQTKDAGRFTEERYQKILEMLNEYGRVTVKELCSLFSVSNVTVRNDLKTLEKQGRLVRTYGGAILSSSGTSEPPFQFRMKVHSETKQRIGRMAAELVTDGEAVFIDGGTTAASMKQYLQGKQDLTVITPSTEIAYYLSGHPTNNVFVRGSSSRRDRSPPRRRSASA